MNKALLFVVLLCAVSCTRHPAPVIVAGPAGATELAKAVAVPAVVVKVAVQVVKSKPAPHKAKSRPKVDKAAMNFLRAACLNWAVDRKIAYDMRTGVIHDFGNVLTAPVCAAFKL